MTKHHRKLIEEGVYAIAILLLKEKPRQYALGVEKIPGCLKEGQVTYGDTSEMVFAMSDEQQGRLNIDQETHIPAFIVNLVEISKGTIEGGYAGKFLASAIMDHMNLWETNEIFGIVDKYWVKKHFIKEISSEIQAQMEAKKNGKGRSSN